MEWAVTIPAFLASIVEFVEAFTIVLVVGITINWRSAMIGAVAAVIALAVIVAIFGTAIVYYVPLDILRLVIGFILVLFGEIIGGLEHGGGFGMQVKLRRARARDAGQGGELLLHAATDLP